MTQTDKEVVEQAIPHKNTVSSEFYGMQGKQHTQDTDEVFAKKVWNGRYFHFYVRHATSGPEAPHLMNPYGVHYVEGDHKHMHNHTGKRKYEYRKVSETAFNLYKLFLETGKQMYYRQADRALD